MPTVNIQDVEAKKTRHPRLDQELTNVASGRKERVSITVSASLARLIKSAAKAEGRTIKRYVLDALGARYPELGAAITAHLEAGHE